MQPRPKATNAAYRAKKDLVDDTVLDDATRRALMNDIQRIGRPGAVGTKAPVAPVSSGPSDSDLLSVMMERLKAVEQKSEMQRREISELQMKLISATDHLAEERNRRRKAEEEQDAALDELAQIHSFLSDYGLSWVGGGAVSSTETSPVQEKGTQDNDVPAATSTKDEGAKKKFDLYAGEFKQPKVDPSVPLPTSKSDASQTPAEGEKKLPFQLSLLKRNAAKLTEMIGFSGVANNAQKAMIKERDIVRVCVYLDGICVNSGPFRPYGWALCDAFLSDLLDGFFPYEFKDRYPEGYPIEIIDKSTIECPTGFGKDGKLKGAESDTTVASANDHGYKPLSRDALLKKLPQQYITPSGKLINVQADVAQFVGGTVLPTSTPPKPNFSETVHGGTKSVKLSDEGQEVRAENEAKIQVRMPQGQRVVLHMNYADSIHMLREELIRSASSFFSPKDGFELCTVLPRKQLTDLGQSIEQAGLVPTCALFVLTKKPGA